MTDIVWKNLSALIVDDERYMRTIAHRALQEIGFGSVIEANDGAEALKILDSDNLPPNVVLLDLDMPVLSGFGVLSAIRSKERLKDLPVVILSGHSEMTNIIKAAEIGIHGFAVKPVSQAVLKKQLTRALKSPPIDPALLKR